MSKLGDAESRLNHISGILKKKEMYAKQIEKLSNKIVHLDMQLKPAYKNLIKDFHYLKQEINKDIQSARKSIKTGKKGIPVSKLFNKLRNEI